MVVSFGLNRRLIFGVATFAWLGWGEEAAPLEDLLEKPGSSGGEASDLLEKASEANDLEDILAKVAMWSSR